LKKARSMRNSLHNFLLPINQLPPETLALIATHLAKERELINVTAVCQYWRMALISFPRLWYNVGGSSAEIEAYLERSKSVPIDVDLRCSERDTKLIVPHTHRLAALTIRVRDQSSFSKCVEYLHCPIPTLHSLYLDAGYYLYLRELEPPSSLSHGFFSHLKKLDIGVVSSFRGLPHIFPCVTELTLRTTSIRRIALVDALEQLPALEKIHIMFYPRIIFEDFGPTPRALTLPHVKEMSLSASTMYGRSREIPWNIVESLKLPNLTSLRVQSAHSDFFPDPILPVAHFGENLPNLAELPELQIDLGTPSSEISFRGPSQAVFSWIMPGRPLQTPFPCCTLQMKFLFHSVRRLTVCVLDVDGWDSDEGDGDVWDGGGCDGDGGDGNGSDGGGWDGDWRDEIRWDGDRWLISFFQDLPSLEHLEVGGECGGVLRDLHCGIMEGWIRLHVKDLIVRGGEEERRVALELETAMGLDTAVTFIPDPKMCEEKLVRRG
jgi:hypothetical protein